MQRKFINIKKKRSSKEVVSSNKRMLVVQEGDCDSNVWREGERAGTCNKGTEEERMGRKTDERHKGKVDGKTGDKGHEREERGGNTTGELLPLYDDPSVDNRSSTLVLLSNHSHRQSGHCTPLNIRTVDYPLRSSSLHIVFVSSEPWHGSPPPHSCPLAHFSLFFSLTLTFVCSGLPFLGLRLTISRACSQSLSP